LDTTFPDLKTNLRKLRGGRSQAEFAKLCGLPQPTIAKYELGKAVPGGDALYKIANACKTNIEWILTSKSVDTGRLVSATADCKCPRCVVLARENLLKDLTIAELTTAKEWYSQLIEEINMEAPDFLAQFATCPSSDFIQQSTEVSRCKGGASAKPAHSNETLKTTSLSRRQRKAV
jgi:transcriptional regulator with XRE-family HTH domain